MFFFVCFLLLIIFVVCRDRERAFVYMNVRLSPFDVSIFKMHTKEDISPSLCVYICGGWVADGLVYGL